MLVTVALPVYNEEQFIRETLESVINQDYCNIEILISDNASTDNTEAVCLEYAAQDERIKYYRQEQNIGVSNNFIYLTKSAQGKFIVWIAGHDKWSPNLVSECVKILTQTPSATIAYGTPVWIGETNEPINKYSGWYDTRGCSPFVRFFMTFWGSMNPILGVIRAESLPDFNHNYNFVGSDLVLLSDLALRGEFIHCAKATFYRRQNRPAEDYRDKLDRYKSKNMQISDSLFSQLFPLLQLPFELLRTVIKADIYLMDKILIITLLLPSLVVKYIIGRRDNKRIS